MAYLGYSQASPARWSNERGYRSYNLNMSVSHTLHLGMIACTIPTHPLARTWVQPALDLVDDLLNEVGPAGEWPESVSNYVHVSGSALLHFAIKAQTAGFHDFVNDPRMKRLLDYIAEMYAPCDLLPREPGEPVLRGLPPHGRAQAGHRFGLPGMMARATRDSDPRLLRGAAMGVAADGGDARDPQRRVGRLRAGLSGRHLAGGAAGLGDRVVPPGRCHLPPGAGHAGGVLRQPDQRRLPPPGLLLGDGGFSSDLCEGGAAGGVVLWRVQRTGGAAHQPGLPGARGRYRRGAPGADRLHRHRHHRRGGVQRAARPEAARALRRAGRDQ